MFMGVASSDYNVCGGPLFFFSPSPPLPDPLTMAGQGSSNSIRAIE